MDDNTYSYTHKNRQHTDSKTHGCLDYFLNPCFCVVTVKKFKNKTFKYFSFQMLFVCQGWTILTVFFVAVVIFAGGGILYTHTHLGS
jgi:hypothetical protein